MRLGNPTPRICVIPPYVKTYGDEVNDLMRMIGRPPDYWQAEAIKCAFGVQADGLWSAYEQMYLIARQNGKGYITDAIELGGLFLFREPLIFHSAHEFKTSRAAFTRLEEICKASDWLSKRVNNYSHSKSDEGIFLTKPMGGGKLQFVARTNGSGRGLTGSTTVFDEAFALTIPQYQAQTPTLSTIPNPRIIYTSSPPDEDVGPMPADAMLPSVRKRGHRGAHRVACLEWSPPKDFNRHDIDAIVEEMYRCNPSLGIRISEWFLRAQLTAFAEAGKPEKFFTEHLGLWPADPDEQWRYVPEPDWTAAHDPESRRAGRVALCVTMSLDRQWTTISVAGRRGDGLYHIEVAVSERGTGWVAPKVKDLVLRLSPSALVIPSSSNAAALKPDLDTALEGTGTTVRMMSTAEEAQACGGLWDGISGPLPAEPEPGQPRQPSPRTVRHRGQGVLTTAIAGAVTKKSGGTQTWDHYAAAVDTTPAAGVANALWADKTFGGTGQQTLDGDLMA